MLPMLPFKICSPFFHYIHLPSVSPHWADGRLDRFGWNSSAACRPGRSAERLPLALCHPLCPLLGLFLIITNYLDNTTQYKIYTIYYIRMRLYIKKMSIMSVSDHYSGLWPTTVVIRPLNWSLYQYRELRTKTKGVLFSLLVRIMINGYYTIKYQ